MPNTLPSAMHLILEKLLKSQSKRVVTPLLPSAKAISLRKQFYNWRTSVWDHFADPGAEKNFRTYDCDDWLRKYNASLSSRVLREISVRMDPILSVKSTSRRLIFEVEVEIEVMELLDDGSLRDVNIMRADEPLTHKSQTWTFDEATQVEVTSSIGGARPAEQAKVREIAAEKAEAARPKTSYTIPPEEACPIPGMTRKEFWWALDRGVIAAADHTSWLKELAAEGDARAQLEVDML